MFSKFSLLGLQKNYGEIAEHSVPRNCTDFFPILYEIYINMYIYIYEIVDERLWMYVKSFSHRDNGSALFTLTFTRDIPIFENYRPNVTQIS